jgi:hypothetical protein
VDDLGVIVQIGANATGDRTYVVMSGDRSAAGASWAEFTADELAPVDTP